MEETVTIDRLVFFAERPMRWRGTTANDREVYIRYRHGWLQLFVGELPQPLYEGELDPGSRVEPFYQVCIGDPDDDTLGTGSLVEYLGSVVKLPDWVSALARKEAALRE